MSKYTTQLRWIVEQACADAGVEPVPANWQAAYPRLGLAVDGNALGLAPYPIYDELKRPFLNDMIIRRYWKREIGAETAASFAWNLNDALCLIMPYYNQLWSLKVLDAAHLLQEDFTETVKILENLNVAETIGGTSSGSGSSKTSSSSNSTGRMLDTPQARIQNLDDGWLTNASKDETTESGNASSESSATSKTDRDRDDKRDKIEERTHTIYDPNMYAQLLTIGRDLLNIPRMIVEDDEVQSCFMTVW